MNFHLPIAYWCVLVAAVLPYLCAYIAKVGAFGPRDNVTPRDWASRQSGWRARANAARSAVWALGFVVNIAILFAGR